MIHAAIIKPIINVILLLVSFILFNCTPSKEFLLRQNKEAGKDRVNIRVLLKTVDGRVLISSKNRMKITDIKTGTVTYDDRGKDIYIEPDQITRPVLIEAWGPLSVDSAPYRGMIELHNVLGKIFVINVLKINEYLYGVVPCEIISTWETEALKAQSVAARTYTYHHLTKRTKTLYDVDATNNFQVYKGISVEKETTTRAVDETSGKIAVYYGKPIIAFFHSTCGGRTMDNKSVWNGESQDYLKPVECDFCGKSPYYNWEEKVTLYDIKEYLKNKYGAIGRIESIAFERKGGRVASAAISHKNGIVKLTGNELRLLFPEKKMKSMNFTAKKTKDGLIVTGRGWGHGVGMCQWGARGMAEKGADFAEILKYYYKGISINDVRRIEYAGR